MSYRKKISAPVLVAAIILAAAALFFGVQQPVTTKEQGEEAVQSMVSPGTEAQIYYLDVGQGDSELIRLPSQKNILIDAGTGESASKLVSYLKELGVEKIDYLIATHPHADHIGGMTKVVKELEIGKIYMPKIADSQTPTTKTYENLLDAIADKGLKITAAKSGMIIFNADGTKIEFLGPVNDTYDNLNNYSIVAKLTYGEKEFLFAGDAEKESGKEMLARGEDVSCDVLKVGHHGSNTATTSSFLKATDPTYAVISCGVNNDYGHPHQKVLDLLQQAGVKVYRTDQQGTILAHCDGEKITFDTNLKSLVKKP